jgi:hypothetical protein
MTSVGGTEENSSYFVTGDTFIDISVRTGSETSENFDQRLWITYHVGIVRIHAHIRERVETGHSPKSQMTIELRERVLRVLASLHLR